MRCIGRHIGSYLLVLSLANAMGGVSALAAEANSFLGRWALTIPSGGAGWLGVEQQDGPLTASILWGGGSVVPVVDMRLKFDMSETQKTVNTCIIIVEIMLDREITVIGAMADSVQEVFELEAGQIEPPPKIGTHLNTEFIKL